MEVEGEEDPRVLEELVLSIKQDLIPAGVFVGSV